MRDLVDALHRLQRRHAATPTAARPARAAPASAAPGGKGDRRRSARRTCAARRGPPARSSSSPRRRGNAPARPATSPIWKAMPRATPSRPSPISRSSSAPSSFFTCCASQRSSRACTCSSCAPLKSSSAMSFTRGFSRWSPAPMLADRLAQPADQPVVRQHEGVVDGLVHAAGARLDLGGERLLRGGVQRLRLFAVGGGVGGKTESKQRTDVVPLDHDLACRGDFGFHHDVLSQAAHQHAGAPVNESLGQTRMKASDRLSST